MKYLILLAVISLTTLTLNAQSAPTPTPAIPSVVPIAKPLFDKGEVTGRTYTNRGFGFEILFPDAWLIPGDDFEAYMKERGFDLALKAPDWMPPAKQEKLNNAMKSVTVLVTAYRAMPGSSDNAILRVSAEDLSSQPQIKDAVDYFDAIRSVFAQLALPPDFKYSETQAETLGDMQFGFLDTTSSAGKKRMYATVRNRHAIMFTLSYSSPDDLATMRRILEAGNFHLRSE